MLHMQKDSSQAGSGADNDRLAPTAAMTGDSWTIREIAEHYDVTPRTLRFYEDKALLSPGRESGHRVYIYKDRVRLEQILRAKRLGFSLDDISDFIDVIEGRILGREDLMRRRKAYLRMVERLDRKRDDIDVVTKGLQRTAARIKAYAADPARDAATLNYAEAYDAVFKQHMDDDFSEDTAGYSGAL